MSANNLKCNVCGERFWIESKLQKHILLHSTSSIPQRNDLLNSIVPVSGLSADVCLGNIGKIKEIGTSNISKHLQSSSKHAFNTLQCQLNNNSQLTITKVETSKHASITLPSQLNDNPQLTITKVETGKESNKELIFIAGKKRETPVTTPKSLKSYPQKVSMSRTTPMLSNEKEISSGMSITLTSPKSITPPKRVQIIQKVEKTSLPFQSTNKLKLLFPNLKLLRLGKEIVTECNKNGFVYLKDIDEKMLKLRQSPQLCTVKDTTKVPFSVITIPAEFANRIKKIILPKGTTADQKVVILPSPLAKQPTNNIQFQVLSKPNHSNNSSIDPKNVKASLQSLSDIKPVSLANVKRRGKTAKSGPTKVVRYSVEDMKRDDLIRKQAKEKMKAKEKILKKMLFKYEEKERKKEQKFLQKKIDHFFHKNEDHLLHLKDKLINFRYLSFEDRVEVTYHLKNVKKSICDMKAFLKYLKVSTPEELTEKFQNKSLLNFGSEKKEEIGTVAQYQTKLNRWNFISPSFLKPRKKSIKSRKNISASELQFVNHNEISIAENSNVISYTNVKQSECVIPSFIHKKKTIKTNPNFSFSGKQRNSRVIGKKNKQITCQKVTFGNDPFTLAVDSGDAHIMKCPCQIPNCDQLHLPDHFVL